MTRNFLAATAAFAFAAVPAFGQFTYSEAVSGDLSDDESMPTLLPFVVGSNTITGTVGGAFDTSPPDDFFDAFTFTVPAGFALSTVTLDTYAVAGGNTSSGLNFASGTSFDGDFNSPDFLFSGTLTPAGVGSNVLPEVLSAGDYTVSIREGTPGQTYGLTFDIGVFTPPPPPPATSVVLDSAGSVSGTLAASEVLFYEFDYDGLGGTIDTFGTTFDTELGLYNVNGSVVASNDDAGGLQSEIGLDGLDAGTYYLALGGFNTVFGGSFDAVSTSTTNTGPFVINGIVVPEPTSLALVGLGGLAALRRRRA